jgi:hypothetical protein
MSISKLSPLSTPTLSYHGGAKLTKSNALEPATGNLQAAAAPALALKTPSSTATSFSLVTSQVMSRSAFSTTYLNADGTQTQESSVTPMNFQSSDGTWAPIVTTVTRNVLGGYSDPDQPLSPTFGSSTLGSSDLTVSANGDPVTFNLVGADASDAGAPSSADLGTDSSDAGSAVAYKDIQPGIDLLDQVTPSGVNQSLVLGSAPTSADPSWTWDIHAPGLTLSKGDRGEVDFKDANGTLQLITATPTMWDSSGATGESSPASEDVPYTLAQLDDGDWAFTVTPDATWLDSSNRVYPVHIDPSPLDAAAYNETVYPGSGGTPFSGSTDVGNPNTGGNPYYRTVESYHYGSEYGEEATGAELALQYESGTTTAQSGEVYDPTGYSYSGAKGDAVASYTVSSGTSGVGYADNDEMRQLVQKWLDSGNPGSTLGILGNETPSTWTYKQLAATLVISYEDKPTVAIVHSTTSDGRPISPNGITNGPVDPVLEVSSTDPTKAGLNYTYLISTTSNPLTATGSNLVFRSPPTASQEYNVPEGTLNAHTTYLLDRAGHGRIREHGQRNGYRFRRDRQLDDRVPTIYPLGSVRLDDARRWIDRGDADAYPERSSGDLE